jgi:hypothetical protein
MSLEHKFLNHNWKNGFSSENTILKSSEYFPEVMFLGTFNPNLEWNDADFYYGRNMYMWPILTNLFLYNKNQLHKPRTQFNLVPNLEDIFTICNKARLSFAEIISEINGEIEINNYNKTIIINKEFQLKGYKDRDLNKLGQMQLLVDNIDHIANFVNSTPSIKTIYLTFKDTGKWFDDKVLELKGKIKTAEIRSIFTPTGNGFRKNLPLPYDRRAWSISHCWVWNGMNHPIRINKIKYGNLDHKWLTKNGVSLENF